MPERPVQHWLKLVHDRPERRASDYWLKSTMINDPHVKRPDGKIVRHPKYRSGDELIVYLTGVGRCVAAMRVVDEAEFDPARVDREVREGDGDEWGWVTDVEPIAACDFHVAPSVHVGDVVRGHLRGARRRLRPHQYEALLGAIRASQT